MKVSIVIPAYNEEAIIGPCIEAVRRAVEHAELQEGEYEIIVVNNASTDRTREVASAYAVRVVDESWKGLTRAKQAGLKAARGELIAHPDADTLMPKDWLRKALTEFERHPKLVALSGPYIYYDLSPYHQFLTKAWLGAGFVFHLIIRDILRQGAMVQGGNYIARRDALLRIGGYDTSIEFYGEDFDIARRLSAVGKVKWTWKFPMYSSGRRLAKEGVLKTAFNYGLNNMASTFLKRPVSMTYTDVRPAANNLDNEQEE